ncbi:MAG: OmpA family protein [Kiloniellales bacterium]|nr:OmpA family protein [Kiloniellales bacterium]
MRKYSLIYTLAVAPLLAASLALADSILPFTTYQEVDKITPSDGSFSQELAADYKAFTLYEAEEMNDWLDAEVFAQKALRANEGQAVQPEDPADWNIAEVHRPTLAAARGKLVTALDGGGRDKAPELAAEAQAKYDCWVEQQEEGHQADHIAACRGEFEAALAKLEAAMAPKAVAAPAATPAPAPPAPEKTVAAGPKFTVGEEIARTVIYFGWNQAAITTESQARIDALVEQMGDMRDIILFVEGHADRSGPADYNVKLSETRAQTVRAELVRQGMNVGEIDKLELEARGEDNPAVRTPDGVREAANRRVEIVVRGLVTKAIPTTAATTQ